jgi:hypothetical protein
MRFTTLIALLAGLAACSSTTENTGGLSPTVVPAGAADPAWVPLGKTCTPESPVLAVTGARRDSLPAFTHGPSRTVDDDWADAARVVPGGWGGLILESGTPVIFLVDTTQRDLALASLRDRGIGSGLNMSQARVRPGRWDFAQLADWFRYLQAPIESLPGLRSADIQEARNRLEYGVNSAATSQQLAQLLAARNVPCYLVAVTVVGP